LIAYLFCWRERKRKYVSQWQTARSKQKWTSIATVPDLCPTTVKILTHLISRYHLPLRFKSEVTEDFPVAQTEIEFLNFDGAKEFIPRKRFRKPM
jgi:hypothetical protein